MLFAKTRARFRRWLHLVGQLATLPFYAFTRKIEVHKAVDAHRVVVFVTYSGTNALAFNEITYIGCTCGLTFWQEEKGEGHE